MPINTDYQTLCQKLGYQFNDEALLVQSLTHKSTRQKNNERLEFLGDAVLGLVIADQLWKQFPQAREGQLSKLRSNLVRGSALAEISMQFQLSDYLIMGPAEYKSGSHHRESILEDTIEAIVGAIHCDGGLSAAQQCILSWFETVLSQCSLTEELNDAKTRLQEYLQKQGYDLPQYQTLNIDGAEHQQLFTVGCTVVELNLFEQAQGTSRKRAEQAAAEKILDQIDF